MTAVQTVRSVCLSRQIEPQKEPRGTGLAGVVLVSKLRADACEERRDQQRREHHAGSERNGECQPSELMIRPR